MNQPKSSKTHVADETLEDTVGPLTKQTKTESLPPQQPLTCGTCRFRINDQCLWGPPAVIVRIIPKQSPGGLLVVGERGNGDQMEMMPIPSSIYPPAPAHMKACFQHRPIEAKDVCEVDKPEGLR